VSTLIAGGLARRGQLLDGWVEVEGDRIAAVGEGAPPRRPDEGNDIVAPGFVDLQVNGAGGHEVTGGVEALDAIDAIQLARGVTGYLPTLISPEPEIAEHLLPELARRAADPASPVAGVHIEGPYISPGHAGMHPVERLLAMPAELPGWLRTPAIRIVTLAPELEGAPATIRALRKRGVVVSLGHSGASAERAIAAIDAGAGLVTHVFNAMAPLRHREPGLAGVALADDRLLVSVIADGHHIDPLVLELIRRAAGDRLVLVSDSTPAAAAPAGGYPMAGVAIERTPDGAVRTADGRLAGGSLTLDEAVRSWHETTEATLAEAIRAASEVPAAAIGLGSGLEPGAPADILLLDQAGIVRRTMRNGRWLGDG
jgi:N-acetylglucosamine-6-phosphate deacetylase